MMYEKQYDIRIFVHMEPVAHMANALPDVRVTQTARQPAGYEKVKRVLIFEMHIPCSLDSEYPSPLESLSQFFRIPLYPIFPTKPIVP